jgi:uncharacterized phage protein gp47/JayE
MASTSLVIDYTSKDFAGLRDDMLAQATTLLPQWTSRSTNDFGVVMVELFAYMGDILSYYGDRIANEAFLQTATQRRSVLNLASMLDYRPNSTNAATVPLLFTIAPNLGSTTIPAGTRVSTLSVDSDPIYFETSADLVIAGTTGTPAVFTGTVTATEGVTVFEDIGASTGLASQDFILTQSPVIEASWDVFMDEGSGTTTVWTWVDHLIEWGAGDRVYTTYVDENGVTHVLFGDGVNGLIPPALAVVQSGYRVGGGAVGNVGPQTLTTMDTTITGVIAVTNTVAATGGQDAETLDQIRVAAPAALISLNRAVTLSDYRALALKVPGVAKASPVSTVYTSVTLYAAPLGGGRDASNNPIYLSASTRLALSNYMATRIPASTTLVIADPTYVPIDMTLTLVVAPQYNQATIKAAVQAALTGTLLYDSVDFGIRVTVGNTFAAVVSVLGVGYATLVTLARSGGSGAADIQLAPNEIPVPGVITVNASGGILT